MASDIRADQSGRNRFQSCGVPDGNYEFYAIRKGLSNKKDNMCGPIDDWWIRRSILRRTQSIPLILQWEQNENQVTNPTEISMVSRTKVTSLVMALGVMNKEQHVRPQRLLDQWHSWHRGDGHCIGNINLFIFRHSLTIQLILLFEMYKIFPFK